MSVGPIAEGYRWPAEWETHRATWLAWPHNPDTWPGKFATILRPYCEFVRAVAKYEPVRILASTPDVADAAQSRLGQNSRIELVDIPTNDAWIRDYGPTFLQPGQELAEAVIDWNYNAWGGKYPPFDKDNAAPQQIAEKLGLRVFSGPLTLEGGAIESNGMGDLLTTPTCLPNSTRNPDHSRADIEGILAEFIGAKKVHWLPQSELEGDDTDGHIDQLARFVDPTTIVCAVAEDDPPHAALEENYRYLCGARNSEGARFRVVRLPLPPPLFEQGHRLPASYCNFYLLNEAVIVPQFGCEQSDHRALEILESLLPDRDLAPLDAREIVWGLGAFHCLSQPQWL